MRMNTIPCYQDCAPPSYEIVPPQIPELPMTGINIAVLILIATLLITLGMILLGGLKKAK